MKDKSTNSISINAGSLQAPIPLALSELTRPHKLSLGWSVAYWGCDAKSWSWGARGCERSEWGGASDSQNERSKEKLQNRTLVCCGSSQIECCADDYQIGLGKDAGCTAFVRLTGQPPWRSAVGVSHLRDVGSRHLAAFAALQNLRRYWTNNGHCWIFACSGYDVNDPKRTK